jgi:hypothetical protein
MYRTRTQGGFTQSLNVHKQTTFAGGVNVVSSEDQAALREGEFKTTTDVVTPRFHTRIARGDIVNNPFESWTERRRHAYSGIFIRRNSGSGSTIRDYEWSHVYGTAPDAFQHYVDIHDALSEVSTEAAARVARPDVEGYVETAEARQTLESFDVRQWNLRRQVEKELRYALKKGKRFPISVPAQVMANNWLKYRYGILPALRLLEQTLVTGSRIQTRRETARAGTTVAGSQQWTKNAIGGFYDVEYTVSREWNASVRAGILYEYERFLSANGMSLADLPAAAWELVPWSFVADWVFNTGSYIRAITPRASVIRRATWTGYKIELNYHVNVSNVTWKGGSGYTRIQDPSGGHSIHLVGLKRVPSIRSPQLAVRNDWKSDFVSPTRIVDAFALTTQLLHRLMRAT